MAQDTVSKTADWRLTDPAVVDRLLHGVVDLHCHSGPSVMRRYFDHLEAMREASKAGIRALLCKDHCYPTTPATEILNKHFGDLGVTMLSGVPLNNPVGGLNIHAVDHGIKLGARLIWMPTYCAANHIAERAKDPTFKDKFPKEDLLPPLPITILDEHDRLVPEVPPILDLIAEHDVVLSSGHLNIREIYPLFEEAKKRGVQRLLCNHPTFIIGASLDDIGRLAGMGVMIEHSSCLFFEGSKYRFYDPEELKTVIEAAGVDNTILGSDLGIYDNMQLVDGFRQVIKLCLDLGYSEVEIRRLVATNAADLIGL